MAPSAFFMEHWGDPEPMPLDRLVPQAKVHELMTQPGSPFEIEERTVNGRTLRCWKNLPADNYRDFWLGVSQAFAKREYITYEGETFTYEQVYKQTLLVAHWLSSQFQVRRGDRVGIAMRNNIEHVISFWACHLIGAVAAELNAFADRETMTFCIADVGCRVVISDVERLERIQPALAPGGKLRRYEGECNAEGNTLRGVVVIPFGKGRGKGRLPRSERPYVKKADGTPVHELLHDWDDLADKWAPTCPPRPPPVKVYPEDHCHILFTSGTTGKPKGVLATHRQSLHNLGATAWISTRVFVRRGKAVPDPAKSTEQPIHLVGYPLFHAAGLLSMLVSNSMTGSKLVFLYQWDVDEAVRLINEHKCNRLGGVPYQCRQVVHHKTDMPSLGTVTYGGSSSPTELAAEAKAKTGGGLVGNGYGATEVSSFATGNYMDDYFHFPSSAGVGPPTTDIKIMHPEKLVQMPVGQRGEIWIRSPGVAEGYWNRPEATREAFMPDGFYRTGDVGIINEHGLLFVVDRVKDMIIRGGENISCTVVESGAYACPKVVEAAAVALPDKALGERVAIFVVPRNGVSASDLTEDEVREAARGVLTKHEVPEFVVVQADPLPKIPAGKVDKKLLRDELKAIAQKKGWGDFAGQGAQSGARQAKL
ncbi:unnamed protein product [Parajaminaea phylloscopi]